MIEPFSYQIEGDVTLHGIRWDGSANWAICLHEPVGDRDLDDWGPLVPYLQQQGATVVAVDLPGFGLSSGNQTWEHAAIAVRAVVDSARTQQASSVTLIAVGAGCRTALEVAEVRKVDALVLISPATNCCGLRGGGAAKLILFGGSDAAARAAADEVRNASIGWALSIAYPGVDQGSTLISASRCARTGESIGQFLRERWALADLRVKSRQRESTKAGGDE